MKEASMSDNSADLDNRLAQLRTHFPGALQSTYFDTASRGLVPAEAKAAMDEQIDHRIRGDIQKPAMFDTIERVRSAYASLIAASTEEIAFTKNVSEGLNIVAAGLPWKPGDNVVLCPELEHPSNIYPWLNLKSRAGIEVRLVHSRDGRMPIPEMIKAADPRTRVITCSYVTFAPGLRSDVQALAEYCATKDILLLVDAAQGIGILDINMERTPIAAMSVSTQKGLMGLYGMGLLFVRKSWAERLEPAYLSRFSVDLGTAHEATGGSDNYALMPGAKRFEVGNYNFLAATAVESGLSMINEITTKAVEQHVLKLAEHMMEGLRRLGVPVFASEPGPHRAHMVAIGDAIGNQHDATDDPAMQSLYETLASAGVRTTIRRGIIRVAFHLYNNGADVAQLLDAAARWKTAAAA
jgi:cysteine desulfurase / selenocysteine lyase